MLVDQRYLTQPSEMQKRSFPMIQPNITTRVLITYVGEYVGGVKSQPITICLLQIPQKIQGRELLAEVLKFNCQIWGNLSTSSSIMWTCQIIQQIQGDSEEWKQYWKTDLLLVGTLFPLI